MPAYQVRTQPRTSSESSEETLNLGQVDIATFELLRDTFAGEDLRDSHLVKGFDRKLSERVKGEVTAAEVLTLAN